MNSSARNGSLLLTANTIFPAVHGHEFGVIGAAKA